MKIYVLIEYTSNASYNDMIRDLQVIKSFTNKEMAEETLFAKEKVYNQALKEYAEGIRNYDSSPFGDVNTRYGSNIPIERTVWQIQEVELTTDKFTEFALKGTTNDTSV